MQRNVNADERWQVFIFPVADGTVKNSGGHQQRLRTSTLVRDRSERGEEQEVLQGESDELSSPTPHQGDSTLMMPKLEMISGLLQEILFCRHHVEPRVKLYVPREKSFPIPMKYIDVTRNTHTSLDVLLEKNIDDFWNVDGKRELSDAWTGCTRFILLNEIPIDGYSWSGGRLTRKQTTSRPDIVWQICGSICLCSEKESKTKMGNRETKTRQCQTIERNILYWTKRRRIQAHNESRSWRVGSSDASSNALQNSDRKQWRNPPQYWETQHKICLYCWCRRKHETKAGRNSTQISSRSHHCTRDEFYNSLQSCAQVNSDASSIQNTGCKGCSGKRMGKL